MGTIKEKAWPKPLSPKCHIGSFLFSEAVPPLSACHETLLFLVVVFQSLVIPVSSHLLPLACFPSQAIPLLCFILTV